MGTVKAGDTISQGVAATTTASTAGFVPIVVDTIDVETRMIQTFVNAEIAFGRTHHIVQELVRARTVAHQGNSSAHQPMDAAGADQKRKDLTNEKAALQAESAKLKIQLEATRVRMTQMMGQSLGSLSAAEFMSLKLQNEAARVAVEAEELKRNLCALCHFRKSSVLFYPCRHTCVCDVCGVTSIVLKQTACMVCAQPVMDTIGGASTSALAATATTIPPANLSATAAAAAAAITPKTLTTTPTTSKQKTLTLLSSPSLEPPLAPPAPIARPTAARAKGMNHTGRW